MAKTAAQIANDIVQATLDEDQEKLAAAWAAVNFINGKAVSAELDQRVASNPSEKARMAETMSRVPDLWNAVPESIFGVGVRAPLQQASSEFLSQPRAPWATPPSPTLRPTLASSTVAQPPAQAPTPPKNVGQTPQDREPRVVQAQSGIRSRSVSNSLMNVLEFAAAASGVKVVVFSGGQPSKAEEAAIRASGKVDKDTSLRTGSTRHDNGMAADIYLYQSGRELKATNPDDIKVMQAFISASVAAGATGIGAGVGYMGREGQGIHVGYGGGGAMFGPVTVWGASKGAASAPEWLLDAVKPEATGSVVRTLQTNLAALGYDVGPVDGVIGNRTRAALAEFSKAGNSISIAAMPAGYDAFLGARNKPTPGLLTYVNASPRPTSVSRPAEAGRVLSTAGYVNASPRASAVLAAIEPVYGRNLDVPARPVASPEQQTAAIQQMLKDAGFDPGKIDGKWGPQTQAAADAYRDAVQRGQLPGTTAPTPPVPQARPLLASIAEVVNSGGRITKGSSGQAVADLQRFLNDQGIRDARGLPLAVDGEAGRRTREALREYQSRHSELVNDGTLGPRTLAAMTADQQIADQSRARERAFATRDAADFTGIPGVTRAADAVPDTARGTNPLADVLTQVADRYSGIVNLAATAGGALASFLSAGRTSSMSQAEFNSRFDPTMSQIEFNRRFDPTAPEFEGTTGLNFTATGRPAPGGNLPRSNGNILTDVASLFWNGYLPGPSVRSGGIGSDVAASQTPWSKLELSNSFRPHDSSALDLGGSAKLGSTGPGSEVDGTYGALRGAAAFLNYKDMQDNGSTINARFSDAFAPESFGRAFSFFEGGALANSEAGRFMLSPNAYQQLTGGSSGGETPSLDPSGWTNAGSGGEVYTGGYSQAPDAYQQISGETPSYASDWTNNYSYAPSVSESTGSSWSDSWSSQGSGGYW